MDLLQTLDIEMLCLAAEGFAMLLLLSFIWQPTKTESNEANQQEEFDWTVYDQLFVRTICATGTGMASAESHAASVFLFHDVIDTAHTRLRDKLTGLANAQIMDQILEQWNSLPSSEKSGCISMVVLGSYEELLCDQGRMAVEQAIQAMASELTGTYGKNALISRYQSDRFLLLHFASSPTDCHNEMATTLERISDPQFFQFADSPIQLNCQCSVLGSADIMTSPDEMVDNLTQGICRAVQEGSRVLSLVEQTWSSEPPMQVEVAKSNIPAPLASRPTSPSQTSNDNDQVESSIELDSKAVEEPSFTDIQLTTEGISSSNSSSSERGSEIEAFATPDDIAALMQQMKSGSDGSDASSKVVHNTSIQEDAKALSAVASASTLNSESSQQNANSSIADSDELEQSMTESLDQIESLLASDEPIRETKSESAGKSGSKSQNDAIVKEESNGKSPSLGREDDFTNSIAEEDIANLLASISK